MMTAFFLRGLNEYKRQVELQKTFQKHSLQIDSILRHVEKKGFKENSFGAGARHEISLLLLMPLVEVAWADGRVTRREMDTVVSAADAYGLVDSVGGYSELMERLLSRPAPQTVGRMWQQIGNFLGDLTRSERNKIMYCLLAQAKFVAEQSSDSVVGFLRGERICEDERFTLRMIAEQIKTVRERAENAEENAPDAERNGAADSATNVSPAIADYEDYEKLIPIVPLVKTAWAEGRVTKKERHLIFEAAARHGIKPETTTYKKLADWLELHPTDEFYEQALDELADSWKSLDPDEKKRRQENLLSDCTKIAEASGGTKNFPAGGMKICDEEITAVRRIAQKINSADTA